MGTSVGSQPETSIAWVWLSLNDRTSVEKLLLAQAGYGGTRQPSQHQAGGRRVQSQPWMNETLSLGEKNDKNKNRDDTDKTIKLVSFYRTY